MLITRPSITVQTARIIDMAGTTGASSGGRWSSTVRVKVKAADNRPGVVRRYGQPEVRSVVHVEGEEREQRAREASGQCVDGGTQDPSDAVGDLEPASGGRGQAEAQRGQRVHDVHHRTRSPAPDLSVGTRKEVGASSWTGSGRPVPHPGTFSHTQRVMLGSLPTSCR